METQNIDYETRRRSALVDDHVQWMTRGENGQWVTGFVDNKIENEWRMTSLVFFFWKMSSGLPGYYGGP